MATRTQSRRGVAVAQRQKRTWVETEPQGGGRRYWFRRLADAQAHATYWEQRGHIVEDSGVRDDRARTYDIEDLYTVWVSYGKKRTPAVRQMLAGMDPH